MGENKKLLSASESFSVLPLAFLAISCLMLAGCSGDWIGEERAYYMKRDFQVITHPDWLRSAGDKLDTSSIWPTAAQQEAANEQVICMHENSQNRVVQQDGVSDEVAYRRCPLAPYAGNGGSRLGNRPDGNGSVVR